MEKSLYVNICIYNHEKNNHKTNTTTKLVDNNAGTKTIYKKSVKKLERETIHCKRSNWIVLDIV